MQDGGPDAKKVGRPRKYASDAKRPTLTFRVRGDLYENLKTSAAQREMSISEEIERRLGASFDQERRAGSRETQLLMEALASELTLRELHMDKRWFEGPEPSRYYYERLKMALARLMDVAPVQQIEDKAARDRGELFELIARQHEAAIESDRGLNVNYDPAKDPMYIQRYGVPGGLFETLSKIMAEQKSD